MLTRSWKRKRVDIVEASTKEATKEAREEDMEEEEILMVEEEDHLIVLNVVRYATCRDYVLCRVHSMGIAIR
jgi:hypothetical protein